MKPPDHPMNLVDIGVLLFEAAKLSNHRKFILAGSLSAIGSVLVPPPAMVMSRDLDFYPELDPERGFNEIASELGLDSLFHREHGFYADPISPSILALPDGWERRTTPISLPHGIVANFIEPNDIAISKLMRGNDNDLRWIAAGILERIVKLDILKHRLSMPVSNCEYVEIQAARERLTSLDSEASVTSPSIPRG